jgi:hypothetical protein
MTDPYFSLLSAGICRVRMVVMHLNLVGFPTSTAPGASKDITTDDQPNCRILNRGGYRDHHLGGSLEERHRNLLFRIVAPLVSSIHSSKPRSTQNLDPGGIW